MKEKLTSPENIDYLEFTDGDIERITKIDQMVALQYEAVQVDDAYRNTVSIDQAELDRIISSESSALGVRHKLVGTKTEIFQMNEEEKSLKIADIRKMYDTDIDTVEYYTALISQVCENSHMDAESVIQSLKDKAVFFNVGRRIEKHIHKQSEARAREALNKLEEEALKVCDKCITTSQQGSDTRTKDTAHGPQYDSIYYLYKMSNGTYISQRFKRNLLPQDRLGNVIQPVCDLAMFSRSGGPSTLSEIESVEYNPSVLNTEPEIGYSVSEYCDSDNADNFFTGNLSDLRISDVVEITDNGVIIRDGFKDAFNVEHEGGQINAIIK